MKSDVWLTPPEIIKALGLFDLDPCCPPVMPWTTANIMLHQGSVPRDWRGRVWLNPPYSREASAWLQRLASHGKGTALIFARTETTWFRKCVWEKANGILFLNGRIHFYLQNGTRAKANAGAPSCLVSYGDSDTQALKTCGLSGSFIQDWKTL